MSDLSEIETCSPPRRRGRPRKYLPGEGETSNLTVNLRIDTLDALAEMARKNHRSMSSEMTMLVMRATGTGGVPHVGCICPAGAEATCRGCYCPRRPSDE